MNARRQIDLAICDLHDVCFVHAVQVSVQIVAVRVGRAHCEFGHEISCMVCILRMFCMLCRLGDSLWLSG